jgi:hypothetical protein
VATNGRIHRALVEALRDEGPAPGTRDRESAG